jgi:hypothetical protein
MAKLGGFLSMMMVIKIQAAMAVTDELVIPPAHGVLWRIIGCASSYYCTYLFYLPIL